MKIEKLVVGKLRENCYVLIKDCGCLVVDPGDEVEKIKEAMCGKELLGILVTHYHSDHVGALDELVSEYGVKVYDYRHPGSVVLKDFSFEVINTPGHSKDSTTYYFKKDKAMFTGDFLFRSSVGRWDLEGGNMNDIKKSILKIRNYDKDIDVYPGHGFLTTMGNERKNNLYFGDDFCE